MYNPVDSNVIDELKRIVGSENVLTEDFELIPYARDCQIVTYSAQFTSRPEVVVLPQSTEEVVNIVKLANEKKIPLVPRAAGTGKTGNCVPMKGGILLDTKRMDRIIEIDETNMVVAVQVGCNLEKLDKELRKHGFICGHDPASFPTACVGGAIGTSGLGSRAMKYGPMRDQVTSLEVVLPTGEQIRVGGGASGKIGKTSVGYEGLKYLFIGSFGTLGVVTNATLRIFPLPEENSVVAMAFKDLNSAWQAAYNLAKVDLPLSMFGINDRYTIQSSRRMDPTYPDVNCVMTIGFEGCKDVVEASRKRALKICEESGGEDLGPEIAKGSWEGRHDFYPMTTALGPGVWQDEDCAVPFSNILETVKEIREILEKYDVEGWGIEIWTVQPPDLTVIWKVDERNEKKWEDYLRVSEEIAVLCLRQGGTVGVCHGLGTRWKEQFLPIELGPAYELMKKVKKMLDPNNIMNPGRFGLDDTYKG